MRSHFFLIVLVIFTSPVLFAKEIQPNATFLNFVVSIDRRPQKDVSYTKCIGAFWNKALSMNFLMASSSIGDRGCPGQEDLKFDYLESEKDSHLLSEEGKIFAENIPVEDFHKKVYYKGNGWQLSIFPTRITVKVPSLSDPDTLVEDFFCMAHLSNKDESGKTIDKTLIACDDCSTLQKCVDTELPTKKPLRIGGKEVETTPHKKDSQRQRTH